MGKVLELTLIQDTPAILRSEAGRVNGFASEPGTETLAIEEPLEIQLGYGAKGERAVKSISVTMRTPGNDYELAAGFLISEGVIHDASDIDRIAHAQVDRPITQEPADSNVISLSHRSMNNVVRVELFSGVSVGLANLERNFYTTSSCGICGKASLLGLRTVCPARRPNTFTISAGVLYALPGRMRQAQQVFNRTGGLHGAALFNSDGEMLGLREDVGRHNAVDKLLGREFLADRFPLCGALLLLSGRASFELLQKAVMAGIPMVASVGAPSSLAVQVAREFDVALVGFLRDEHFNVYHGLQHLTGLKAQKE
ncbi:MAG: formate dehydrogenase accessory sulfurtransferase FdhD [Terracidiphilus sp.]